MSGLQKIAVIYFLLLILHQGKLDTQHSLTSAIPVHGYTAQFDLCDTGAWVQIPYRPEFFAGHIFTTAPVVHITERITFIHVFIHSSNI